MHMSTAVGSYWYYYYYYYYCTYIYGTYDCILRYLSTADSTVILLDAQSLARRYSCRILLYRTSKLPVSEYLSDGSEHYSWMN